MSEAPVRVTLLGRATLALADGRTLALERKDAALLALLATEGAAARERVTALLWPDAPPKTAQASLRQRLHRLRRASGHALVDSGAVLKLAEGVQTDLADDHGELLGAHDFGDTEVLDDWVRRQRSERRARRRERATAAAESLAAAGDLPRAIEQAQWLADDDPLNEHALRRLMRLHYQHGDRAAALAAHERFAARLAQELGTEPDAETRALLAQVQRAALPAPRRVALPASLLRPPRFVPRGDELGRLARAWAAGRVFLVLGEAGAGKSRLLQEFALGQGPTVAVRALPGEAVVPYALLVRLLRALAERGVPWPEGAPRRELAHLLPELAAEPPAGAAQRPALQRALEAFLAAAAARGLHELLLDDLHFADAATLELLPALATAEPLAALRWGLAMRPAEAAAGGWRSALEDAAALEALTLPPLGEAQLAALVQSLELPGVDAAELAPRLLRNTGGNPQFALDTLKDLLAAGPADGTRLPVPASVSALVERRLRQLGPQALALARVAAIAGPEFSAPLAERVLGVPALLLADAWAELEAAQLLQGSAFAHDSALEATLRSVPEAIARHVHGQVARCLEGGPIAPARLALHWCAAAEPAAAAAAFLQAAAQARRASRHDDEAGFLADARASFEAAGDAEAAYRARCAHIDALRVGAGPKAALAAAEGLLDAAPTPALRLPALLALTHVHVFLDDGANARACGLEAEAAARAAGDVAAAFVAAGLAAIGCAQQGEIGLAREVLERVREGAEAQPDAEARGRYFAVLGYVLNVSGAARAAVGATENAAAVAREVGDQSALHQQLMNLAMLRLGLGQADAALGHAREAAALSATLGAPPGLVRIDRQNVAMALIALGRFGDALGVLGEPEPAVDGWSAHTRTLAALLWLRLGQPARALPLLAEGVPGNVPQVLAMRRLMALDHARQQGRPPVADIDAALEVARQSGNRGVIGLLRLMRAESDSAASALAEAERLIDEARHVDLPVVDACARVVQAEALAELGRAVDSATAAHEAAARLAGLELAWRYKPELLARLARCLERAGEAQAALACTDAARRWVQERALPGVPEPFRESFLHRHPLHRALLVTRQ